MDKESLQAFISHFDHCEKYRIEKVLRSGRIETTEVVYQIAADGSETGPYIRKRFSDKELWDLYKRIEDAQVNGLREPALPRIHDVGQDVDGYYSIVEYVKGSNLRESKGLSSLSIFESACNAVMVLHERFDPPIIHRDIKPDNVIVVPDGVVLIDFGAARSFDEGKRYDTHPYVTRDYAPPEQFGYAQTDRRSDIYSLGMLLAYLELGRDPDIDIKQAIWQGEDALVEKGISRPFAKTIIRACAFDPSLRFNSVSGMLDFLHHELDASVTANVKIESAPSRAVGFRQRYEQGDFVKQGRVWNIIIAIAWFFFFSVSVSLSLDLDGELAAIPIWLRFVEYTGLVMSLFTMLGIMLLDWRAVRSINGLSRMKRRYVIIPTAIIFFVCLLVMQLSTYLPA